MIVPSHDMVHMDFAMCAWALMAYQKESLYVINPRTSLVEVSRYSAVQKALDRGSDAIFFTDSDMTFPMNALERLQAHNVPFVGATYMTRRAPATVLGTPFEELTSDMTGLKPMRRMPIGFSLIRAEVFDAVEPPWFSVIWDPVHAEHTSEDYTFCDAVRQAGFDLLVDLDLSHEMGHIGNQTYKWKKS
jgi:hypothetical protein